MEIFVILRYLSMGKKIKSRSIFRLNQQGSRLHIWWIYQTTMYLPLALLQKDRNFRYFVFQSAFRLVFPITIFTNLTRNVNWISLKKIQDFVYISSMTISSQIIFLLTLTLKLIAIYKIGSSLNICNVGVGGGPK